MALVPTVRGFTVAGRFCALGVALSADTEAIVRAQPELMRLCVDAAAPTPAAPIATPPFTLDVFPVTS